MRLCFKHLRIKMSIPLYHISHNCSKARITQNENTQTSPLLNISYTPYHQSQEFSNQRHLLVIIGFVLSVLPQLFKLQDKPGMEVHSHTYSLQWFSHQLNSTLNNMPVFYNAKTIPKNWVWWIFLNDSGTVYTEEEKRVSHSHEISFSLNSFKKIQQDLDIPRYKHPYCSVFFFFF